MQQLLLNRFTNSIVNRSSTFASSFLYCTYDHSFFNIHDIIGNGLVFKHVAFVLRLCCLIPQFLRRNCSVQLRPHSLFTIPHGLDRCATNIPPPPPNCLCHLPRRSEFPLRTPRRLRQSAFAKGG